MPWGMSHKKDDCMSLVSLSKVMTSSRASVLTGAAEALLPHANQHVQAEIAVGRLVKVLESPHMLSVILHILHRT